MKKEIIALGDIEMGTGTLTDDFISDNLLSKLIRDQIKKKHPVDIVFCGDTMDFLKAPYIENNKIKFIRHITKDVSLNKLKHIHQAHKKVFDTLRAFVKHKKNSIHFLIGNHDMELYFKEVQKEIRRILKSGGNVFFQDEYNQHGVHAEHGNKYDFLNSVPKNKFVKFKGEYILNMPWISFGIISKFLTLKEMFPLMERVTPARSLFKYYQPPLKELNVRSIKYFLKSTFYYPIRYFYDPTYLFPKALFGEFYTRLKNSHWEVDSIIDTYKEKNKKTLNKFKIYIFGHIHEKYVEQKDGWAMVHPDTWRDEYLVGNQTKTLIPRKKNYVSVKVADNDSLTWELIEMLHKRNVLNLKYVVKDEIKYLKLAAKAEGYKHQKQFNLRSSQQPSL